MENFTNSKKPRIYSLIDWFTVMAYDTSIVQVYEWLELDYSNFLDDLLQRDKSFLTEKNGWKLCFNYNGIRIEAYVRDLNDVRNFNSWQEGQFSTENLFNDVFSVVRIDISGSGLQFLRTRGYDVDKRFRKPENILGYPNVNVTRCDFAFDFVDYQIDILQEYIDFYRENKTETNSIQTFSATRPYKVKIREGDERIMYVGSTQQLLRIYDKWLQYYDPKTSTPIVQSDKLLYGDCDSWYRFEFQLRKQYVAPILFGKFDIKNHDVLDPEDTFYIDPDTDNFLPILKYISEKFDFVEKDGRERTSALFLRKIFNWNEIPTLIKFAFNEIKGIFVLSPIDKAVTSINRSARSIIIYIQLHGIRAFWRLLQDYVDSCYIDDPNDINYLNSGLRRRALLSSLNELDIPSLIYTCDNSPLQKSDGKLQLQELDNLI